MKSTKYFSLIFTVMMSMCLANEELDEFVKLFQQKRLIQLSAIKQLLNMNPTSQLKLLDSMLSKMTSVFSESQNILTSTSLDISEGKLPNELKDRTALALVLENTCLASDILLRFPDYMLKKLAKDKEFDLKYKWGLGFINETVSYVMDEATKRLFFLAGQELHENENDPNYVNPYKKPKVEPKKIMFADTPPPKADKKPRKKMKKGPRLTKSEL